MICRLAVGDHHVVVDPDVYEWAVLYRWKFGTDYKRTGAKYPKQGDRLLHRVVAGAKGGELVDHINGDTLDCRRHNLRIVNHQQNSANRRPAPGKRFKGTTLHRSGKWQASIKCLGRSYYLGLHETEEAAARAYDTKALELFGEFAYLNSNKDGAEAVTAETEGGAQ